MSAADSDPARGAGDNATESQPQTRCRVCGTPTQLNCAGCKAVYYCTREHQVSDWKRSHKVTCAKLPAALKTVELRFPSVDERITDVSALCLLAEHVSESGDSKTEGSIFEGFYRHPAAARQDVGAHLKKIVGTGALAVDCSLFVQLVLASQGKLNAKSGPLMFAIGGWGPWIVMKRALEESVVPGLNTEFYPGYLAPKDPSAAQAVQRSPSSGGQWLLGPDSKGFYLGMSSEGPMRLPLKMWHERLIRGLQAEIKHMSPADRQEIAFLLVDDLAFDKYQVYREPAEDNE